MLHCISPCIVAARLPHRPLCYHGVLVDQSRFCSTQTAAVAGTRPHSGGQSVHHAVQPLAQHGGHGVPPKQLPHSSPHRLLDPDTPLPAWWVVSRGSGGDTGAARKNKLQAENLRCLLQIFMDDTLPPTPCSIGLPAMLRNDGRLKCLLLTSGLVSSLATSELLTPGQLWTRLGMLGFLSKLKDCP